ncbi:hypothetical protein JNUCC1_00754 [Lentibacillus sp. JNUCC-1]|uniref:DUF6241 domain-containing protein n=1 Tax=Lentibacillus sp. JNUCC-1 TaxID=2654513 RepID=UPI0012E90C21|nr:DUF6241 domain-containing protein [Lentibacillus sp. JNUCC-1]MUV36948.1 hypothetical protein [Lentibacillus sp. JNUCC-1]
MYKKIIIGLLGATVMISGILAFVLFDDMFFSKEGTNDSEEAKAAQKEEAGDHREDIQGSVTEDQLEDYANEGLNPFGENLHAADLSDSDFQEYIHGMSHQKVRAEKKWGFYELHPKRVKWLLTALDQADGIHYTEEYERILTKWANKDFSSIDNDHNVIWKMQGGTVGKATGILSPKEEKAYLERQGGQ